MIKLCIFLCICTLTWADSDILEPPLRVDMKPPVEYQNHFSRTVKTSWIDMPIDHFDPQNRDMYRMDILDSVDTVKRSDVLTPKDLAYFRAWGHRTAPKGFVVGAKGIYNLVEADTEVIHLVMERFMYNEEFFGGNGYPVFIMVGGEWDIVPGWLQVGNMFLMAQENRGYQIYTEHRYYGQSLPYRYFTTENLRFLNVDQALADLAYFISELKASPRFANSKVILYGGSYAANMVIWFKQRYPHLVVGGVASSGPIKAQVDFTGYLEVVHRAFLSEGGEQCLNIIREGIAETLSAIKNETARKSMESTYRLCEPLDYNSTLSLGYFSGFITWTFSTSVQQAYPGSLTAICRKFINNIYGETPMQQIGGYIAETRSVNNCSNINYNNYVEMYNSTVPSNAKAWYYQTCTEYGFYQTAPRSGTVFDQIPYLDVPFYVDLCTRVFSERFNESFVLSAVERVNLMFGALTPDVNNTINIHGVLDPWHDLGVTDRDLKHTSPTILVPRASHCFDMSSWRATDTIRMTNVQQRARRLVSQWLA